MLRSNASACYLKLQDWKGAVDSATACIDCLERVIPSTDGKENGEDRPLQAQTQSKSTPDDAVVEIPDDAEDEQAELNRLRESDERKRNVLRIRAKALMRRARAKTELGGWGNLQGAEEDYKVLGSMDNLPVDDRKVVQKALRELPARINTAREKEMADMMGKLKDVSLFAGVGGPADFLAWEWDPEAVWAVHG